MMSRGIVAGVLLSLAGALGCGRASSTSGHDAGDGGLDGTRSDLADATPPSDATTSDAADVTMTVDGSSPDAPDASGDGTGIADGADAADGPAVCSLGEAQSEATPGNLDLFGTPSYFNGGAPVPAGTYLITYVDGCMKYGSGQGWTVNAYADGRDGWWLVGATTGDEKVVLPGTVGYAAGAGAFDAFEDCVAASLMAAPVTYVHAGGVLGVWLQDSPYSDNLAGEGGRNPKWILTTTGSCSDGGAADRSADGAPPDANGG